MTQPIPEHSVDVPKVEALPPGMLQAFNDAGLCLMTSIGHRTGLFDAMRGQPASTVQEIASRAGLNARYVREWLGAMVTSGVVEVSEDSARYFLPNEHAAALTREAGGDNMSLYAEYIAVLGSVENDIVDCFRHGGGVPYEKFSRFHEVMAEDESNRAVARIAHPAVRSRAGGAARPGYSCARRRLRLGEDTDTAGRAVPEQPVPRSRPVTGCDRERAGGRGPAVSVKRHVL